MEAYFYAGIKIMKKLAAIIVLFFIALYFVTDYPGRIAEMDHHYCVELYQLEKGCK